jgi:hypothetical protein
VGGGDSEIEFPFGGALIRKINPPIRNPKMININSRNGNFIAIKISIFFDGILSSY